LWAQLEISEKSASLHLMILSGKNFSEDYLERNDSRSESRVCWGSGNWRKEKMQTLF